MLLFCKITYCTKIIIIILYNNILYYYGTSLVVQWLNCVLPMQFGQGTRSHMVRLKILHATTKDK